ncbi:MAG: GGDEF domain-containing protein [Armatimonadetes bacterium]|nr:GGDEF domain-containing protein [Armatimonadota bacterium]
MPLYHILERKILMIDRIRWGISLAVFSLIVLTSALSRAPYPLYPPILLLLATVMYYPVLYTPLFHLLVCRRRAFAVFHGCQTFLNVLLMTGFVHFTGGLESQYYFIYIFEIIIGGTIVLPNHGFAISTAAWVAYAALLELEALQILPAASSQSHPGQLSVLSGTIRMMCLAYIAQFVGSYVIKERRKQLEGLTTRLSRLNERLRQMAVTDQLTQLYNFRYFESRLEEEILRASRYGRTATLILLCLDRFRDHLKAHGQQFCDKMLRSLADSLRANTRLIDIASRYDEDRFLILLPETGQEEARIVAERIRKSFALVSFPTRDDHTVSCTLSAGIASYPTHTDQAQHLLEKADQALSAAKENGKSRVAAFSDGATSAG